MPELDAQDRPLDAVHAVVEAFDQMMVAALLAPVAQHPHGLGMCIIVGDDNAAFAAGARGFCRGRS